MPAFCQPLKKADSLKDAGKFEEALREYSDILQQQVLLNPLDSGNLFLRRGICYFTLGNSRNALNDYFTALHIFETLGNKERTAAARYNLSMIFLAQRNFSEAEKSLTAARDLYTLLNDTPRLALVYNDLGCVYRESGKYTAALNMHNYALDNFLAAMDDNLAAKHWYNKGNCFETADADSCIFYYQKALTAAAYNGDSSLMSAVCISMGDVYKGRGAYARAKESFEKALSLNIAYINKKELNALYANLADLYDSLGIYNKAYFYSKKERELNESLFDIEKSKFASELSEKYESGKKDEKIKSQETENKLKSRNLLLSLVGLGLAAALAVISFISYKRKQKANLALQQQNDRIEKLNKQLDESNQVKSKLFSVISHDIRAPISSIYAYLQMQNTNAKSDSNKAFAAQTEQLLETLEDLLVWSKSQLHQFVAATETVFLQAAVNQITALLGTAASEKQLTIKNNVSPGFTVDTDSNMLVIILRNMLANAIRYSVTGTAVEINAVSNKNSIALSVSNQSHDTASVLSLDHLPVNSKAHGLGITLIKEFAEKINGHIAYTASGSTVTATLMLPVS